MSRVPGSPARERLIAVGADERPAPTWEDLRAEVRRFDHAAFQERLRSRPALVAEIDQADASESEAVKLLGTRPRDDFDHMVARDSTTAAARAMLARAVLRRVEARCRHVEWPPQPTDKHVFVDLSTRAATCPRDGCVAASRARWHDDGCCDLCERPAGSFTPLIAPLLNTVIGFHACDRCVAELGLEAAA